MTPGGWLVMILSVGSVTAAFLWCVFKVLSTPHETDKMHGFDRPTPDEKEEL